MEELGDQEKYSFGIFYNNVHVLVERMPGNPKIITSMRVYDALNNKSATVDFLEPVLEENHEGKRSICTRLAEMAGRTGQNTDYRLEKNASVTVSCRKDSHYCIPQLVSRQSALTDDGEKEEDMVTKRPSAFKATSLESAAASHHDLAGGEESGSRPYLSGVPDKKKEDEEEAIIVLAPYGKSAKMTGDAPKKPKNAPVKGKKKAYAGRKQL